MQTEKKEKIEKKKENNANIYKGLHVYCCHLHKVAFPSFRVYDSFT